LNMEYEGEKERKALIEEMIIKIKQINYNGDNGEALGNILEGMLEWDPEKRLSIASVLKLFERTFPYVQKPEESLQNNEVKWSVGINEKKEYEPVPKEKEEEEETKISNDQSSSFDFYDPEVKSFGNENVNVFGCQKYRETPNVSKVLFEEHKSEKTNSTLNKFQNTHSELALDTWFSNVEKLKKDLDKTVTLHSHRKNQLDLTCNSSTGPISEDILSSTIDKIATIGTLEELSMSVNESDLLTDDTLNKISESFCGEEKVKDTLKLEFHQCDNFTDDGINYLAEGLLVSSSLRDLTLNFFNKPIKKPFMSPLKKITDRSVDFLFEALFNGPKSLERLTLGFNWSAGITNDALIDLINKKGNIQNLQELTLNFSHCPKIDNEGIQEFSAQVFNNFPKLIKVLLICKGTSVTQEAKIYDKRIKLEV